jgi:hypothetical protein
MATSDAVPVIVGAAIGAGGAVFAQITASIFTARRESARLEWEQERQNRDWKMRESDRFMIHKQELYSRYLSITYRPVMDTMELTRREYADQPDWHRLIPEYVGPLQEEIDSLRWNIRLLGGPTVFERVEFSNASLLIAISEAGRPDRHTIERRHEFADNALRAWQQVSDAMRADLRGDEEALRLLAKRFYGTKHKAIDSEAQSSTKQPWWRSVWPWQRGQLSELASGARAPLGECPVYRCSRTSKGAGRVVDDIPSWWKRTGSLDSLSSTMIGHDRTARRGRLSPLAALWR